MPSVVVGAPDRAWAVAAAAAAAAEVDEECSRWCWW
jgi:hypothetical protein